MSRIVFVLLAVLAVFSASSSGQECGPNEEYKTCGTACPLKCNVKPSPYCIEECIIGCQCKPGFLKKDDGSCVSPNNC